MKRLIDKYNIQVIYDKNIFRCNIIEMNNSVELITNTTSNLNYFSTLQFLKDIILVKYKICNFGIHHPQESPYCFF